MMSSLQGKIANSPHLKWLILATTTLQAFMATLDTSIVNVALPTISSSFGINISLVQWVVTAYLLAITSLLLAAGRLGDLIGSRKVYISGFFIFTLGSLLCGLSDNISMLIQSRIIQGVGAACLMALNQSIVVAAFKPSERGKALGINGVVIALGTLAGPALGGLLLSLFNWRSIFYINLPIGIFAFAVARLILPRDSTKKVKEHFDFIGALLFSVGIISLLYGINSAEQYGWGSMIILGCIGLGILLIVSFVVVEKRVQFPMVDLTLYRIPLFAIGSISAFISYFLNTTFTVLYPFYLQQLLHYPIGKVGLIMASFPFAMLLVSPVAGALSDRIGPVLLTSLGLAFNLLGYLYSLTLTANPGLVQVLVSPVLIGLGQAMFAAPNNSSVMGSVPVKKLGIAGGLNALVRNLGYAAGATFAVSLFTSRKAALLAGVGHTPTISEQTAAFVSAYHSVAFIAGILAIVGMVISFSRSGYV
ncbi:MAG TPA: MFS transporter [Bacillota bacterium]|nr:MFS transporter [Bacillota bacterium]